MGIDISFLWATQGWLYLPIILDLYSRRIVGWAKSKRMTAKLPIKALEQKRSTHQ